LLLGFFDKIVLYLVELKNESEKFNESTHKYKNNKTLLLLLVSLHIILKDEHINIYNHNIHSLSKVVFLAIFVLRRLNKKV